MRIENQPTLTSDEICRLTGHYLGHQRDLFETRLEEIGHSRRPSRAAFHEEGMMYAEMANETAAAVRDGDRLFSDDVLLDLASHCGIEPRRVVGNAHMQDALAVAVTRHHRECADRLLPSSRSRAIQRRFGATDTSAARESPIPAPPLVADPNSGRISSALEAGSDKVRDHGDDPANVAGAQPSPVTEPTPDFGVWQYAGDVNAILQSGTTALATGVSRPSPVLFRNGNSTSPVSETGSEKLNDPPVSLDDPVVDRLDPNTSGQKPDVQQDAASATLEPSCDGLFSTIWDAFVDRQILTKTYAYTRRPELGSTRNMITWLMGGDFLLKDATTGLLSELQGRYLTLPVDYKNMRIVHEEGKRWRTYTELMKHISVLGYSGPTVKGKSWNKHKSNLSECVKWAKANRTSMSDLVNGFTGLHIAVKKSPRAAKLEREMTPGNCLVALFMSPVWTGRNGGYHLTRQGSLIVRDSLYWVPLMETGNGVRREEACQLRVRHITRRFGIWMINLLAKDLRLKTDEASPRLVMIHREVLDAGFIEALVTGRDPDELLFEELSNDNAHCAYGVSFGKQISGYVSNVHLDLDFMDEELLEEIPLGLPDHDKLVADRKIALLVEYRKKFTNHGIRHWWKTIAVNSNCHPAHVDDQLGHVGETRGEGHRYQKELDCRVLKETVDRVPMPFKGSELKRLFEASLRDKQGMEQ